MNSENNFKKLKEYALYLKQHKVKELALLSVHLAAKSELPSHFKSDQEMTLFLIKSFENFLSDIIEKNPIEGTTDTLYKARTLPVYYEMNKADIHKAYEIRKKALNDFLSEYTQDMILQKEIHKEISILLLILQKIACQSLSI
jgi:hypothetical protein